MAALRCFLLLLFWRLHTAWTRLLHVCSRKPDCSCECFLASRWALWLVIADRTHHRNEQVVIVAACSAAATERHKLHLNFTQWTHLVAGTSPCGIHTLLAQAADTPRTHQSKRLSHTKGNACTVWVHQCFSRRHGLHDDPQQL